MNSPAISVIIINYNSGAARLQACLDSLIRQAGADFDLPNVEIIVLDNASSDGSEAVADNMAHVTLIRSDINLGFAGGVNMAAEEARGKWLALLNPDTIAAPNWLISLIRGIKRYPQCKIFGSVQIDAADHTLLDGLGDCYHPVGIAWRGDFGKAASNVPSTDKQIFAACGAAACIERGVFEKLGGLEESFFCYHEDVDFGIRLHLIGEQVILLKDAVIYHEGSGTTGRYSDFTVYHGNRNRIRTFIRTMPPLLFWPLLPVHILLNLAFLGRAMMIGTGKPCARALRDGFFKSGDAWRQRKQIQQSRTISTRAFARTMTWSPMRLLGRKADMRDIR